MEGVGIAALDPHVGVRDHDGVVVDAECIELVENLTGTVVGPGDCAIVCERERASVQTGEPTGAPGWRKREK